MKDKEVDVINYEIDEDGGNANENSALPSDIEDED
jgi:hypothetical protein